MEPVDIEARLPKGGAHRLAEALPALMLKHDERRMALEERLSAGQDALFLAFRVDLDEIDDAPTASAVLQIETSDSHRLTRTTALEAVELARGAEREVAFPRAVRHRSR